MKMWNALNQVTNRTSSIETNTISEPRWDFSGKWDSIWLIYTRFRIIMKLFWIHPQTKRTMNQVVMEALNTPSCFMCVCSRLKGCGNKSFFLLGITANQNDDRLQVVRLACCTKWSCLMLSDVHRWTNQFHSIEFFRAGRSSARIPIEFAVLKGVETIFLPPSKL